MPFGTSPVRIRVPAPSGWLLSAALALLVGAIWLEPRGSHLAEPDETRYAEISREMLANRDFVTPRLNGVPFFEKPPLLYWTNSLAFRYFGESPWAARLPARLAALATALLLLLSVGKLWGGRAGLAATIFYLASPLGFALSRVNVTDGVLTFFFAATLFAGRATIRRYENGRGIAGISALTGAAAAGAMLSKGAVGVVLPGLILLVWCAATGRLRAVRSLVISAAPPVFLLLSTPWFAAMEARHPGFLRFFFVREHLERFATSVHDREQSAFYFLLVFLAGFLCGLPFLFSAIRRLGHVSLWRRVHQEELFFILWLAVVIAFFSFSGSKLAPYILPAFPAAAALAGRAFGGPTAPAPLSWQVHAALLTLLLAGAAAHPAIRSQLAQYELLRLYAIAAIVGTATAWAAALIARRSSAGALSLLGAAWAILYAGLALAWPRLPGAVEVHDLGQIARRVADDRSADLVFYRTFLNGVVWEMRRPAPLAAYNGVLLPVGTSPAQPQPEVFWSEERFWAEWSSGRPLVAVIRERHLQSFEGIGRETQVLARGRGHFLVANFPSGPLITRHILTSAGLYAVEPDAGRVPLREIPPAALARAKLEIGKEKFVWAMIEQEAGNLSYELVTGGRVPKAVEVTPSGELIYVEEELPPHRLPSAVLQALSRVHPGGEIAFATREFRRSSGPAVLYEIYVRTESGLRELCFDPAGRLVLEKDLTF